MAVPEEVREAAMLDGASGLRQDRYITIPMIKGTLKTVSVLAATSGFLLYNEVYFLTKRSSRNLQYQLHYPRACHHQSQNPVWTCQRSGDDPDSGRNGDHSGDQFCV